MLALKTPEPEPKEQKEQKEEKKEDEKDESPSFPAAASITDRPAHLRAPTRQLRLRLRLRAPPLLGLDFAAGCREKRPSSKDAATVRVFPPVGPVKGAQRSKDALIIASSCARLFERMRCFGLSAFFTTYNSLLLHVFVTHEVLLLKE